MCGPHHCLGRDSFASGPQILRRLLQLRQNASIPEQGCAGFSPGSANRCDQFTRYPGRTSSPLRPHLSCRYTQAEFEVWKQDTTGRFQILKIYPICRWSGDLGPKLQEGDRQAPEGFYTITPELMNPNSNYYLSINVGYPNSFDKANKRDGSLLMIHGDCSSMGCYAMTDEQISEIYSLARDSLLGRPAFQVQAYPFRLTPANLARHRNSPNLAFWKMLKIGNDHFETTHLEPKVDVCNRRYVFDAQPPSNSPNPLVFNPTDKCPAFVVNPTIARGALEKQRADELEYARLLQDNVPAAPIYSGLDGGMNKAFLAQFPGRIMRSKVLPYASYLPQLPPIPWIDNDGSLTE